jgi:hypothetical protein
MAKRSAHPYGFNSSADKVFHAENRRLYRTDLRAQGSDMVELNGYGNFQD